MSVRSFVNKFEDIKNMRGKTPMQTTSFHNQSYDEVINVPDEKHQATPMHRSSVKVQPMPQRQVPMPQGIYQSFTQPQQKTPPMQEEKKASNALDSLLIRPSIFNLYDYYDVRPSLYHRYHTLDDDLYTPPYRRLKPISPVKGPVNLIKEGHFEHLPYISLSVIQKNLVHYNEEKNPAMIFNFLKAAKIFKYKISKFIMQDIAYNARYGGEPWFQLRFMLMKSYPKSLQHAEEYESFETASEEKRNHILWTQYLARNDTVKRRHIHLKELYRCYESPAYRSIRHVFDESLLFEDE